MVTYYNCNDLLKWGYVDDEETGLYYLQTRYYSPENVRFLNADIFVFTGRGILDSNIFAYCLNSPVFQHDAVGTCSTLVYTSEADLDHTDDYEYYGCGGGGGGGNTWGAFIRTLQGAANGLTMPLGRTNMAFTERHHLYSNKNKTYTPKYKEITDQYGVSLNSKYNIVNLKGHKGRHTNGYHEFMLFSLEELDAIADGNVDIFLEGLGIVRDFLTDNSWLPYGK